MLIDMRLRDFIEELSSEKPAPGGGSASALSASLGAALFIMVMNLTRGKKFYNEYSEEVKKQMAESLERMESIKRELEALIDEDTNAYNRVMAAFKLPKNTDEEKRIRNEEIQKAYKVAIDVPYKTAKISLEAIKMFEFGAKYGNPNAITDIAVGCNLLYSGIIGALYNVRINLNSINDDDFVNKIKKECDDMIKKAEEYKRNTISLVECKL